MLIGQELVVQPLPDAKENRTGGLDLEIVEAGIQKARRFCPRSLVQACRPDDGGGRALPGRRLSRVSEDLRLHRGSHLGPQRRGIRNAFLCSRLLEPLVEQRQLRRLALQCADNERTDDCLDPSVLVPLKDGPASGIDKNELLLDDAGSVEPRPGAKARIKGGQPNRERRPAQTFKRMGADPALPVDRSVRRDQHRYILECCLSDTADHLPKCPVPAPPLERQEDVETPTV